MVLRKKPKPKPPQPTGPSGPTAVTGPTAPTAATGPTGPTPTIELGSYGNASIDQWDQAFGRASDAVLQKRGVRVDPYFIKAMMEVESGGDGFYPASRCRTSDGTDNVPACGPMQIKHAYHRFRCPECDFKTVPGQIELATHIVGMPMKERGWDEYRSFLSVYFPTDDINGTTQQAYVQRLRSLVAAMKKDAGQTPEPEPKPQQHPLAAIFGGTVPRVHFGFRDTGGVGYPYGVNHGTTHASQHTGLDIDVPFGTKFYAPAAGVITCVGEKGSPTYGQGCGFFRDTGYGGTDAPSVGVGNVRLRLDNGLSVTFGHSRTSNFRPGDRVKAGDWLGTTGGMLGPHMHLETASSEPDKVPAADRRNGVTYWLREPVAALREAMGGTPVEPRPATVPYVWDSPNRNLFRVTIDHDTAVHQRADPAAPKLYALAKGKVVDAVAVVPGNDGEEWYLLTDDGRLPRFRTSAAVKVG